MKCHQIVKEGYTMAREQMTFEKQVIEDGRRKLLKKLNTIDRDMYSIEDSEPEVYIKRSDDEMKRIKENFENISDEGKKRNIEVYLNSSYSNRVYFRYIFFVPFSSF